MAVDTSVYERQRRGVNDQYAANASANAYARTLSQRRGNRQLGEMSRQFGRNTPRFTASYGRRGLAGPGVRSGVYQQAMQRYVSDYSRGRNNYLQDMAEQNRQYDLNDARFQNERQRALADIEAAKQRDIALAALNIQQLRPLIGG